MAVDNKGMVSGPLKDSAIMSSRTVTARPLTPYLNSSSASSWRLVAASCERTDVTWRPAPCQAPSAEQDWLSRAHVLSPVLPVLEVLPGNVPTPELSESMNIARTQPEGWDLWEGKDVDRPFSTTEMHSVSFLNAVLFGRWSTLLESVYVSVPERIGHIFVNIMYFIILYTINMPAYHSF